jgi:hypothetical protein
MTKILKQLERNDTTEERKASDNEIKISSPCSHLKLAAEGKEFCGFNANLGMSV